MSVKLQRGQIWRYIPKNSIYRIVRVHPEGRLVDLEKKSGDGWYGDVAYQEYQANYFNVPRIWEIVAGLPCACGTALDNLDDYLCSTCRTND